jgi:DHA1 family bicyclomycin/chloramphenicol resistance-like MFS transporter
MANLLAQIGFDLLNPPALAGTLGMLTALAGSAAAMAGMIEQITGTSGCDLMGWVPH